MSTEQRLDLEREDRRHESTQSRYAGRLKFTGCHECGGVDGMRSVHHDELQRFATPLSAAVTQLLMTLYSEPGNSEYLFYSCRYCNGDGIIPDSYEPMSLADVLYWINYSDVPMAPDYEEDRQ